MLSGRYPSDDFAELRPRIVWDRVTGKLRGRAGAQRLAVTNPGTIPDRGLYTVNLVENGRRVGELDEEMVYETRVGENFVLGASTWRIMEITPSQVLVIPAPGEPGKIAFWKADSPSRPVELGAALGKMVRELRASEPEAAAKRLRENAARSLLLPRRRPGLRTPLWQQRMRSAGLLQVAGQYPDFPILAETWREVMTDHFDMPALLNLLRSIRSREIRVVAVDTERASPFASSILFSYVAEFMYEGDQPLAERRAQALTLDRDLLAELLGSEDLRELLDPEAIADVELELQGLLPERFPRDADEAHDLLARLGDLSDAEARARGIGEDWLRALEKDRRAGPLRPSGVERRAAALQARR